MKTTHTLVTIFALLASSGIATARKYNPEAVLPQLHQQLAQAASPQDSVKILYDIYDISPRRDKIAVGRTLYDVAGRAKDVNAQLDIMRLNSNLYNNESELDRLHMQTRKFTPTQEQRETELFLKMRKLSYASRQPDKEMPMDITQIINRLDLTPDDQMDNIDRLLNIYTVAAYMRNVPDSKLLEQYVDSMVHMVNNGNYRLYALRNIIYSEAANIYSDAGQTRKAVEANRKMLEVIDGLEQKYLKAGRKYRDYDVSRYIVYRRMLRNYKALTPNEVDRYYNSILKLAETNPDIEADLKTNRTPHAFYYMAHGHYAKTIPLLKEAINDGYAYPVKRQLHIMLQKAARETGDSATLLKSLADLNNLTDSLENSNLADRYRELQIAYEVNTLAADNYKKRIEEAEAETARLRTNFTYNLLIWGLFAITLTILLFYWTRYRTNIARLRRLADSMAMQRDMLKNSKYNDYGHPDTYIHGNHIKTSDTRTLIESILTSVLYTAAIGNNERNNHMEKQSATEILQNVKHESDGHLIPASHLRIAYPEPDFDISTDVDCLKYLLEHIIKFAYSRGADSPVTLTAKHTDKSNRIQFIFTHSGPRIPRGYEESLFEYIVNIEALSKREDSSMMICRLVALLLQCNITYNPHTEGPAQLILSLPMNSTI